MSIPTSLDTLTSGLASIARLSFGIEANPLSTSMTTTADKMDATSLGVRVRELYDIESSRECRMVRERITELDLVVDRVIPAASNSRALVDLTRNFSSVVGGGVIEAGTPCMLVSESAEGGGDLVEKKLVGSGDILTYFDQTFGSRSDLAPPVAAEEDGGGKLTEILNKAKEFVNDVGSYIPNILRYGKGQRVADCAILPDTPRPSKPLILYSYEGNQFCRLVREVLTEIDVTYELRSAGKGSPRRAELAEISGGSTQCPFLVDPNTGSQISESKDIIQYLYNNYAKWSPPSELLQSIESIYAPVGKPLFAFLAPLQAGNYKEDSQEYDLAIQSAKSSINTEIESNAVVIYTYELSPFSTEAKKLLDSLEISYKEISLGLEWIPGLIAEGGAEKRAALGLMTGQTSLPHVFVAGESIGGLFSGNSGLIPLLEKGALLDMVEKAESPVETTSV